MSTLMSGAHQTDEKEREDFAKQRKKIQPEEKY